MSIQSRDDLEKWYDAPDPWGYEQSTDDLNRRAMLLAVLPEKQYSRVLDIGCGDGFVTHRLPGESIIGVDLSEKALDFARRRQTPHVDYRALSIFDLPHANVGKFDLVVITGVLYPQHIGEGQLLVYTIIDELLEPGGHLVCAHITEWYRCQFPYISLTREYYRYREFSHVVEVYVK
jgi:2-polyprenyl-3-methyl-5-hydroxy-6-metoxy-1,4-benzoquinol methylase